MTTWTGYLARQPRAFVITLSLVLAILIAIVDYRTGPELASSIFYLLPVSLAAWFAGRRAGGWLSFASALSWFAADVLAAPSHLSSIILYWNTAVNFGSFLIVAYVLSALQAYRDRQEELMLFIVHDLRSPLGSVTTGLQTLQDLMGLAPDPPHIEVVEICLVSCDRMLMLINSLLDLARLEGGRMPVQRERAKVKELVELSLKQVTLGAMRQHVTLAAEVEPNIDTVYADPTLTVRVLVNLLGNATRFSPPESTVTVRVTPFEGNQLAFSVMDHGPGIPKEWTDKVFDKFAQVQARQAGGAVGSGLGLTFCRLAVEAQAGRIWLESDRGKGTTVIFTLPVDSPSLISV